MADGEGRPDAPAVRRDWLQEPQPILWTRICQNLDMPAILKFRTASTSALRITITELSTSLERLLGPFVDKPSELLTTITHMQAFIGGDVALRFFLRAAEFTPLALDIHVAHGDLESMVEYLCNDHGATKLPHRGPPTPPDALYTQFIERQVRLRTPTGRELRVIESAIDEPRAPIACGPSSHLFVYVNAAAFGAAYPKLLFAKRGLLGRATVDPVEVVRNATKRQITVRARAREWDDLHFPGCGATKGLCATQGRTFDDQRALCARVDPRAGQRLASGVIWRLTVEPCGGGCLMRPDSRGLLKHQMIIEAM